MSFSQTDIQNIKPEILSLTIIELINNANVSVRLRNSINSAAADGYLPFQTVADFISSGQEAKALLLKLNNLGERTVDEFISLVNNLFNSQSHAYINSQSPDYLDKPIRIEDFVLPEVLSLSVQELVNTSNVSVRLKNAINNAVENKKLPYYTIKDIVYHGHKSKQLLLKIPNIGKITANEFISLINNITYQNNQDNIAPVTESKGKNKFSKKSKVGSTCRFFKSYNDTLYFKVVEEIEREKLKQIKLAENSIAKLYPERVNELWDYEKNEDIRPDQVQVSDTLIYIWFKCPIDGYSWQNNPSEIVRYSWSRGTSGCSRCGNGWTTEAIRQFVASMEKHIPNLTQAERYKIFEQAGVLNSKASESVSIIKSIIKGKLSGQKLNEYTRGIEIKTIESEQDTTQQSTESEELSFLDTNSKREISNIIEQRVEYTGTTNASEELPTIKVRNSLEFLSSQIVASADHEAIDYFVASRLNRIWAEVFMDESAVEAVESYTDEGYGRQVRDKFLDEYYQARDMTIPTGWAFRINGKITAPNLMQKLSAVRLRNQKRVLNLSLTGTGKTIGGILSSRIIDARLSIIICPLDTIPNWNAEIKHTFPNSKVTIKNFDPYWECIESGHHYILLNHEMFQQPSSSAHVRRLLERFKIDLIIVDEIHRCKQRSEDSSKRRQIVLALITNAAEINPDLHVLGMSATPVINNLKEGKSLVELVSGVERSDLGERATINNCMRIHQAFVTLGIRSRVKPKIRINRITLPIDCSDVVDEIRESGTSVLKMEQILTRSRIPVILQEIRPKTIIYSHYVEGIVDQLQEALEKAGWTIGFHIGGDKSGRDAFINGSADVLIASSAMSVGIDGFQRVCDQETTWYSSLFP